MRRSLFALAFALSAAAPAAAQQDFSRVQIRVERVAPGVAVLFGAGGNIGLSYGEDGNILIDDQFAPLTERILAAVRSVDPDPVRFVINTHWHGDHTGGNENVAREGAVIVAHDNVRRRMSMEQVVRGNAVPASPRGALPSVTFSDDVTFHLNGDEVRAIHVAHAHTDGDALVYWTRANVLHMGDTFFRGFLPFIDLDSGGSVDGLLAAVDRALGIANESTVIVPGHGPLARRSDLVGYRDTIARLATRVRAEIRRGRSLDQIKALRLADPHGRATDFISPDAFIETLYRDATRERGERG
ncbi:MAG TPA: MBL fold metallo-hydrolase [Allosphingosinicella sp.]|jgi:glyoxylase-like metal-dependent hydrolase (beta-lactamase superfamily II)